MLQAVKKLERPMYLHIETLDTVNWSPRNVYESVIANLRNKTAKLWNHITCRSEVSVWNQEFLQEDSDVVETRSVQEICGTGATFAKDVDLKFMYITLFFLFL